MTGRIIRFTAAFALLFTLALVCARPAPTSEPTPVLPTVAPVRGDDGSQKKQVEVRARMIEVSLTKMRDAGLKFPDLTGSPVNKNDAKRSSDDHQPTLLGIVNPGHPLFAFFDELEKKFVAKTIADPTLIALVGLDAHFHSGGQVPILQQRVNGKLSTEFATFGSELTFKSEALGDDRIRLTVKPRFAELDKSLEVSVGGRTVPGLNVRECQASAELASGDTMVLGGMPRNVVEFSNRDGVVVKKINEKALLVLVTATLSVVPDGKDTKLPSGYYYGGPRNRQPALLARPTEHDDAGKFPDQNGGKK